MNTVLITDYFDMRIDFNLAWQYGNQKGKFHSHCRFWELLWYFEMQGQLAVLHTFFHPN